MGCLGRPTTPALPGSGAPAHGKPPAVDKLRIRLRLHLRHDVRLGRHANGGSYSMRARAMAGADSNAQSSVTNVADQSCSADCVCRARVKALGQRRGLGFSRCACPVMALGGHRHARARPVCATSTRAVRPGHRAHAARHGACSTTCGEVCAAMDSMMRLTLHCLRKSGSRGGANRWTWSSFSMPTQASLPRVGTDWPRWPGPTRPLRHVVKVERRAFGALELQPLCPVGSVATHPGNCR